MFSVPLFVAAIRMKSKSLALDRSAELPFGLHLRVIVFICYVMSSMMKKNEGRDVRRAGQKKRSQNRSLSTFIRERRKKSEIAKSRSRDA